jgi:hypothetical protein
VADLDGRGAVLQQQREQDGGVSRKCVQSRILLRSVEKYLAQGAIREASDLHPKTMAGVLELDGDRASSSRQTAAQGHVDPHRSIRSSVANSARAWRRFTAQPAVVVADDVEAVAVDRTLDPGP